MESTRRRYSFDDRELAQRAARARWRHDRKIVRLDSLPAAVAETVRIVLRAQEDEHKANAL